MARDPRMAPPKGPRLASARPASGAAPDATSAGRIRFPFLHPDPDDAAPTAHRLLLALAVAGIALRLAAYLANRSLFIDEAALALSVRDRSLPDLLSRPLDYAQTAPAGFLVLLEASTGLFGESEYSLRLPALLAGVASVPLFALLAWRILPASGALVAVALFAFGRPLVYYSTEAKQYSFDVLFAAGILLLALPLWMRGVTPRRALALGVAGALAVWFSQPAPLVLAGVGLAFVASARYDRGDMRILLSRTAILWATSGVLAVAWTLVMYTPESGEYMRYYWRNGFFPLFPTDAREATWLLVALATFGFDPLGINLPFVPLVLAAFGGAYLLRTHRALLWLAVAPAMLALAASAFELYPFGRNEPDFHALSGRLLHFLVPGALLLVGAGASALWSKPGARTRRLVFVALAGSIGSTVAATVFDFPYTRHEARGVLREVAERRVAGEVVFVDYRAQHYFRYYAPELELDRGPIRWGGCHNASLRNYVAEWEALRPYGRAWLVTSNETKVQKRIWRAYLAWTAAEELRIAAPAMEARRVRIAFPRTGGIPETAFRPVDSPSRDLELSCSGAWKRQASPAPVLSADYERRRGHLP